jgi:hypothetical protein
LVVCHIIRHIRHDVVTFYHPTSLPRSIAMSARNHFPQTQRYSQQLIKRVPALRVQYTERVTNPWRLTMRYRMFLLLSVLVAGILGMALPAPAYDETNAYNLERAEIRGYVEAVENQVAYVQTDHGEQIAVQLGPESYWNAHHYDLPEGEYVTMEVWYDPTNRYTDWYFAGEIWGPGFDFVLTNDEGVPYWVLFADDYYYSLGYRMSCVSYMVWYDCPPVYFVYLILPPPPPRMYLCFYGPHWRNHHNDWGYGPRFCRGGSYWHDGRGYERPGRRSRSDPRGDEGNPGGNMPINSNHSYQRPAPPAMQPAVIQRIRIDPPQRQPVKPQPGYDRKVAASRNEPPKQNIAFTPPLERKVYAQISEPQQRQIQLSPNHLPKREAPQPMVVRQAAPLEKSQPRNIQQSRAPHIEKDNTTVNRVQGLKIGHR